jgi:transposase
MMVTPARAPENGCHAVSSCMQYLPVLYLGIFMAPHLSQQLRDRIISWSTDNELPITEIAALAGCSTTTVYRILQLHREHGQATNPLAQPAGRSHSLSIDDLRFITSLLDDNPAIYLDEIQDELYAARQVDVSIATLSRTIRRLAYSHKSISKAAAERDELLRATWRGTYADIPKESFVWLDESSIDDLTNQRMQGWSRLGQACVRRQIFLRGQRYSALPALTVDGMVALDIFPGSVTKERFIAFLRGQVVRACIYMHTILCYVLMLV